MTTGSAWPAGWEVLELNPAHVGEQRRVAGRRRVKTDAIDLEAITELVLAGRGMPVTAAEEVSSELTAWAAHRSRRVGTRTATKNQLLGQLDRSFPGLTWRCRMCWAPRSVGSSRPSSPTRPGWPGWVVHGSSGSLRIGNCGSPGRSPNGWSQLPGMRCRPVMRSSPAGCWPRTWPCWPTWTNRSRRPKPQLAELVPASPFRTLTSVPGWGVVRAAPTVPRSVTRPAGPDLAALPGGGVVPDAVRIRRPPPGRWDQPGRQRRTPPRADRPRDRAVAQRPTRQGLRRRALRARGKHGGIIACALAHRANRIAYALTRDRACYDPPAGPDIHFPAHLGSPDSGA